MSSSNGDRQGAMSLAPVHPGAHRRYFGHPEEPPKKRAPRSALILRKSDATVSVECLPRETRLLIDERADFHGLAKRMNYAKGDCLVRPNDSGQFVHLLIDGVVCEHSSLADGRRLVSRFALPGDFIGLWRGGSAAAEALEPVLAFRIAREDFFRLLETNPLLPHGIHAALDREIALGQDRMMLLARYTAREKVAAFLMHILDRWHRVNGRMAYVPLPMTRQDIGDFLAIRLETASRTITAFAREGLLIVVPEGVRILDLPRIRAIASV